MSDAVKRMIRVFIASPGDLVEERRIFRKAIEQLNVGFGDGANVEFVPLGWEDTLASTGRRNQGVINEEIDSCDVFILAMNRRWGQDASDAKPYSSYTEEEFHRALERWKSDGAPEIFVFFKRVDAESEGDPGPQLRKVMDFRKHLEETRQVLYHYFDSPQSFLDEVDRHLRAYAKDELPKADRDREAVVLPIAALKEVEEAKETVLRKTEEAKRANDAAEEARLQLEAAQLQLAEDAAKLSMEGKIEFAREKLTKLVTETTDLRILSLGFEFFYRTGDLDSAAMVLEKWLGLSGTENRTAGTAVALGNLGVLFKTRGEFDRAEEMHQKALAIDEAIGRKEGMACDYCNIGNVYLTRGELDRAEEMYQKSLAIDEAIGRKEGMAIQYGNLGILYQDRGDLYRAEEMHQKALTINEALGRKEGMASNYGNLGILYQDRGDLDRAEEMHRKALAINEAIGRKEGMAKQYGNLGVMYSTRGELDRAEEMHQKALAIDEALGRKEGMARDYCNLGNLYQIRGELDRTAEMHQKSLVLFRELQSPHVEEVEESLRELRGEDG
ncbi:tetratricopeptide repeat protein [Candidatus Sumerlaeota bacterium]|nr:tetratricopeptide repeat protein [Candidatus Sumerlaeota bacterium]